VTERIGGAARLTGYNRGNPPQEEKSPRLANLTALRSDPEPAAGSFAPRTFQYQIA